MLVLSRRNNEQITIESPNGEKIVIHIIELRNTRMKIGIDAPQDYLILRDELIEAS
jgi:carbon storage regulator CsrA